MILSGSSLIHVQQVLQLQLAWCPFWRVSQNLSKISESQRRVCVCVLYVWQLLSSSLSQTTYFDIVISCWTTSNMISYKLSTRYRNDHCRRREGKTWISEQNEWRDTFAYKTYFFFTFELICIKKDYTRDRDIGFESSDFFAEVEFKAWPVSWSKSNCSFL